MAKLRGMPEIGEVRMAFDLQRVDQGAPETSGRLGGVQIGWPRWTMKLDMTTLTFAQADRLRAWARRLRGQQRRFLGRDTWRPYPIAHAGGFRNMLRVGGGAFDGTAGGWSDSLDSDGDCFLTLDDVPSGLILTNGDYIGFKWESVEGEGYDRFALVTVDDDEPVRADETGSITVEISPVLPTMVPVGAIAYLNAPVCLMKLAEGTQMPANERGFAESGSTIAAVQVLEP